MDAQEVIYRRIEKYNKELEETRLLENKEFRMVKEYVVESILQELRILLLEFQG